MAFDGEPRVLRFHALAIVFNANQPLPAELRRDGDPRGAGVNGVFDQLLDHRRWSLDDLSGRVEQIRWRHTAIRTRNGELVIVPNSVLMRTRFQVLGNPDNGLARQRLGRPPVCPA